MKITGITTHAVGNRWKNWLFVRVDTDEGIHGLGEGTLNGFCHTVEAAVHELEPMVIGRDPFATESLVLHLARDLYSEGGQIHGAAIAAIEIACWDIKGKALGMPLYELLGGLVRDRVPVYANGWYQVDRTTDSFARAAVDVVAAGYRALKFDPFGTAWRTQTQPRSGRVDRYRRRRARRGRLRCRPDDRGSQSILALNRDRDRGTAGRVPPGVVRRAGPAPERCRNGSCRSPFRRADRHRRITVVGPAIRRTLSHGAIDIVQPEPVSVGGIGRTKIVAGLADAHYGMVAPHNAQGPVCSMVSLHLGASTTNFYYLESFEDFNEAWTRDIVIGNTLAVADGCVEVSRAPGLGVDLDWDALSGHPYQPEHVLRLHHDGWERRVPQALVD